MRMHSATKRPDGEASNGHASQSYKGRRHSKNKKASDPFLELQDEAVELSDQPSPNNEHDGIGHSLLADVSAVSPLTRPRLANERFSSLCSHLSA